MIKKGFDFEQTPECSVSRLRFQLLEKFRNLATDRYVGSNDLSTVASHLFSLKENKNIKAKSIDDTLRQMLK